MCFYWEAWLVQCSYFECAFAVLTVGFLGVIWGSLGCYDVFVFKKVDFNQCVNIFKYL